MVTVYDYLYVTAPDAEMLVGVDREARRRARQLGGRSVAAGWEPVVVKRLTETGHDLDEIEQAGPGELPPIEPLRRVDLPRYELAMPVLSDRAREAIGEQLAPHGEFLELQTTDGERYWLFNVLRFVDALDEPASEILRFDDGGLMDIPTPVFVAERLEGLLLFGIPQISLQVYATDEFVELVEQAGLTGVEPSRVAWTSDG